MVLILARDNFFREGVKLRGDKMREKVGKNFPINRVKLQGQLSIVRGYHSEGC